MNYKYSDKVQVVKIQGWYPNEKGLITFQEKEVKGVMPFGAQSGVLAEEELTDAIAEYLLSKVDENGNKIYEGLIVKKQKGDK